MDKHSNKAGTFAGSAPTHAFDKDEDAFWRKQFEQESYFQKGMTWDDYEPAYRYGYDFYQKHPDRKFEDMESDMSSGWDKFKAKSRLKWENAKDAVRAAWDRAVYGKKHHAEHH
jgi:hypothetical protein